MKYIKKLNIDFDDWDDFSFNLNDLKMHILNNPITYIVLKTKDYSKLISDINKIFNVKLHNKVVNLFDHCKFLLFIIIYKSEKIITGVINDDYSYVYACEMHYYGHNKTNYLDYTLKDWFPMSNLINFKPNEYQQFIEN